MRTWVPGTVERISRQASIPVILGMRTSMTTRSGVAFFASRTASSKPMFSRGAQEGRQYRVSRATPFSNVSV